MMRTLKWAFGWSKEATPEHLIWPDDQGVFDLNRCIKITAKIDVGFGSALYITGDKIHDWQKGVRMKHNPKTQSWEIYISKKFTIELPGNKNQFQFLVGPFGPEEQKVTSVNELRLQDGEKRKLEARELEFTLDVGQFPNYFRSYSM